MLSDINIEKNITNQMSDDFKEFADLLNSEKHTIADIIKIKKICSDYNKKFNTDVNILDSLPACPKTVPHKTNDTKSVSLSN